ncbi:hypothetical protein Pla52o_39190 [Novipirellula galeiformis]|uniref:DUF3800 domain-containing protein n=1 Tax=Novipirellula galeiformis TaxID=2528004 RepID=A0A5C6CCB0_9BACT|nr:DUF3800 domain-containing protein [Novipirellula galeiformis]TWU21732.1 hypothetical protein Pla52o_39190 [Novipirellula galeiformis]
MATEFVIYTDESVKDGAYFSNFYGGVLVRSHDLLSVSGRLAACKAEQNLHGELKWTKVTENYLDKYASVMDAFFDLIAADLAKVRIMFTNNTYIPQGLTSEQRQSEYHRLYYQFIKHGFGLAFSNEEHDGPKRVRLNMDQMPTSREETAKFKSFIEALSRNPEMRRANVDFDRQQIAEVNSKDHDLLQCLDVVLGAMTFRLNNLHQVKPEGQSRRGKRTIAKEKLYKHISARVRLIYSHFNIGESTGIQGDLANRWRHPYRHWKLVPRNHDRDMTRTKP